MSLEIFGEYIYFVPSSFLHMIFVFALLMTWVSAFMKKIEIIPAFVLCILWVFIFYSKVHYGYHMMIFSLLIPWALHIKTIGGARVCWVFPDCSSSNMEGYLRYSKLSYPLAVSIRDVVVLDQLGIHPHQMKIISQT